MKRSIFPVIALILALSLLLGGCAVYPSVGTLRDYLQDALVAPATEPTTDAPDNADDTAAARGADPIFSPTSFGNMVYERPDVERLCADIADVQALVEKDASLDAVLDAFYAVYDDYRIFSTMTTLAYIHYTLDLEDAYYTAENAWCDEQSPLVQQAMEKCYIAMSQSPLRNDLEAECFGEGFFAFYDDNRVYSNDRVVALMQQEAALETQYTSLQSNMTITWQGEERLFDDVIAETQTSYEDYLAAYAAYYDKYNPLVADLYIQLIRVRREIAEELGYDSYADFAYSYTYERDYTPAQVATYTDALAENLSPLFLFAAFGSESEQADTQTTFALLQDAAHTFGGEIGEAFDYMLQYDLYDLTESSSKMPGSYMTYLSAYEMPFVYVSPTGTLDDLLTEAHEFGHFVDGYVNCDATFSIDCSEIFSQGLEYLVLDRADLTAAQRKALTASKISDAVLVFLAQGCYAAFEQAVYELPDDELTAENLNQLFLTYNEKFGMTSYGLDSIIAPGWIDIQHFIIAPFYVISYCVSNDAALQIYQREKTSGDGLTLYRTLLSLSAEDTVLQLLDEAGMASPLSEGRVAELADFLTKELTQ